MDQTTPSLQEIQDKIRAAATAAGINPDTALRIANAESVFSNTAKNPRSSARGLFQVIDQTWKDLGGDPKLRNDLDENIRIGIKAISNNRDAFLKKYGVEPDTKQLYGMHFLGPSQAIRVFNSADDAAIKNIVPKKVIKANPFLDKMSVADFINFTQTKMDKKGTVAPSTTAIAKTETAPVPMPQAPRETMQQAPTKAPATKEVASAPMNRNRLAELGANYQAALGAIALADSAEDDEDDELLMEKYAERFGDQTVDVPITSALSNVQLTYTSPFEEPAPVQMSEGGDPSIPFPTYMSIDEIPEMPPNPTPEQEAEFFRKVEEMDANAYWKRRGPNSADELNYSPSRKMLDEFKSNMPTGDKEVGVQKMAFGGIPYKPSALIPSAVKNQVGQAQADLDAYNQQVGSYNAQLEDYKRRVEDYNTQVNAYDEQRNQYLSSYIGGENPTVYVSSRGQYRPAIGSGATIPVNAPNINVLSYGKIAALNNIPGYYIRQGDYRTLGEPRAPGNAPGGEPQAPTQPTQTIESAQSAVAAAKDKQRRLQLTYDVMEDPERFNLSMPALFAEGGEALPELGSSSARDMQDYLNSSVSGNKDVLQGMVGGQAAEGIDARLIGTYMQSLPPKFAQQFLLNLEIAKKAGVNLNKEGVANIYANIANGDTNYQIGYSPAQKSVNLSRMDGNSGIGLNIGRDNVGLNYASRFAGGGVADRANQPITTPDGYEITPSFADRMGANVSDFVVNVGTKAASLFPVDDKMSAAHRLYLDTFGIKENRAPVTKDYFNQEEMAALTDLVTRKGGKKGSITYNDYKTLMGDRPVTKYPLTSGRLDPYVSISKSLGQFNYEYDPKTGSYKILDEYDFNPKPIRGGISSESNFIGDYIGEEQASLMDKLRIYAGRKLPPGTGRQVDLSVPAPRKRAGGSPVYGEIPDSGGITPDTRAALTNYEDFKNFSPREAFNMYMGIGREGASNAESLARGSAAAVPGTFGDIGQEFDIRGLRNLPTTEQLLKKYPQRLTKPTTEAERFTNFGTYLPLPIPPSAVSGTAKALMKGLKESGPQVESIMRKIAPESEPFYILRPTGGEFSTVKSINEAPISKFDEHLAALYTSRPGPDYAPVTKFFDTKIRDYFKKQAGSVSDPVREALISGKIKIPKGSKLEEIYPEALINAARDGDTTAMKLIEKQLDEGLNLRTYKLINPRGVGSGVTQVDHAIASDNTRLAILQQMKNNPNIIPDAMLLRLAKKNASKLSPEEATKKVADIRAKLKANPELFSTVFEEKIMKMISQSEEMTHVVTPEFMDNYPTLYGKLKGIAGERKGIMSLEGAAPVIDSASVKGPTLLGMSFNRIHTLMQNVPPKELERMDVPTMLNKVIQLDNAAVDAEEYTKKAEKLIYAGKAVPEEITTYGTKPFTTKDRQGFMWREITEPDATTIHAKLLGNSIGGYALPGTYGKLAKGRIGLTNGEVQLFGLYDNNNQLVTNVEYLTKKADVSRLDPSKGIKPNTITQFFGNGPNTGNAAPENYLSQVIELVNKLSPDEVPPSIENLFYKNSIFFDDATGQVTNR